MSEEEEEMRRVWVERDDEKRTKNDHDEAFFTMILSASNALGPDNLITASPAVPGAVDKA